MKKIINHLAAAVICITALSPSALGSGLGSINKEYPEIYDGVYNGYDLDCPHMNDLIHDDTLYCWSYLRDNNGTYCLESRLLYKDFILEKPIRVPDSVNGYEINYIDGSCDFREFNLNPENKYMKCVDNVIFSKDGKTLMSYAKFDERTEYTVPNGTEVIRERAFSFCDNIIRIDIPDSVKSIEIWALSGHNLSEVYLSSFNVKINKGAFGSYRKKAVQLKSYIQPKVYENDDMLIWEEISNASYYEIYQKLSNGEYKLLNTTKDTSCRFGTLKSGKEYTFAVKPIAVIPAANYDKENDEGEYPESFTIEGTMLEDISVCI